MWKKIKNAAKKVGSAVVGAAKGIFQGIKQVINIIKEAVNRVLGVLDFLGSVIGLMPRKRLRVRIIVLADEHGQPLLQASQLDQSIAAMNDVFAAECKTRLRPADASMITFDSEPAPEYALTVNCGTTAYGHDFGDRGLYFGVRAHQNVSGFFTGYAAPVTVFVVRSQLDGGNGCSLGPLTDYVTVVAGRIGRDPRIIAHEVAHACGLWHWNKQEYLMRKPILHGPKVNRLQRSVFRNSRHVTFL